LVADKLKQKSEALRFVSFRFVSFRAQLTFFGQANKGLNEIVC
jgi:hypothetical protein